MDPKIKTLAPQIWAAVEKADNILLHCHYNPDQDSIGSALAMMDALEGMGKKVTVIKGDSDLPNFTKYFPGSEKIVLKNYFKLDLAQFDLFIILDSADSKRISVVQEVVFPSNLKTVVIDHHSSNLGFGDINLVVTNYPATAQILFDLFTEWKITITPAIAQCLLVAIHSDTGGFKYRNTSSHTFAVAAELAKIAPDFDQLLLSIYGSKSLATVKFIGYILDTMEVYFAGKVTIGSMDYETTQRLSLTRSDTHNSGVNMMLKEIDGVVMSFLLIENQAGKTGISSRSSNGNKYNVMELMKKFGGGGHTVAAGATVDKPLAEVKQELLNYLTGVVQ